MNTILRDLSIIWTLIHCCVMFMFLYESRYLARKTNIITSVFMIPVIVVNLLNVHFFGIETASNLIIPCCVLPSLVFFFVMAKNRDTRFLFTFCVVDTIVLEVLIITNLIDGFFGVKNYVVMFFSRLIILPLLEVLIVKCIRKPYRFLQQNMEKGWGIFSILAALFYGIIILTTYYPTIILKRPEYIPQLIWVLVLVPIMYITVFKVLWTHLKLYGEAEKNRVLNMHVKMVDERLKSSEKTENSLQILSHDMKHQMLLLDDYIKNRNFDEAEKHIGRMIENIDKSSLKSFCENHFVNVVLSYYNKIADEKGIEFEVSVEIPETISVNESDLAVVLSNGLENAINAVEFCDNKKVAVKAFTDANNLYLEIKNPFNDFVEFEENLPKSKRENHGYGTKSMAAIVDKYGGIYSFCAEDGFFIFRCSM